MMVGQKIDRGSFAIWFNSVLQTSLPDHQLVSAEPLTGGLSNRCWQVTLLHTPTLCQSTMVWRPQSRSTEAFGLSRQQEFILLSSLSTHSCCHASLAPRAVALLEQGLLVEWVRGHTADEHYPTDKLLQLQAHIHSLPVPEWRLDCRERAAHYWLGITEHNKDDALCAIYHAFQHRTPILWFADTCCHHDLGGYNIILPSDPLTETDTDEWSVGQAKVIDWEYAAAGDPSLDLTLTIVANGLNREYAVNQYCLCSGVNDEQSIARWHQAVTAWQPWCDYLAMLWFYVGAQLWPDLDYQSQANQLKDKLHLDLQSENA
ncbi:phosphotransferase [Photobacterium nomapromontoriensis]|uniref:phosphotransferase n=1 Tax=Photobacterium nomapromontoriensis TaxID=2910237 RepID=UPI003D0C92D7